MITILRGVSNLDAPLILRRGTEGEGSTLRTFLKNQSVPQPNAINPYFLFKQVESATYQLVYLIHTKRHTKAVKIFLRTFDSKSKNIFTPESLSLARCDPGTHHGMQTAPHSDLTQQTYSQLNAFFQTQKEHNKDNIAQNQMKPPKR